MFASSGIGGSDGRPLRVSAKDENESELSLKGGDPADPDDSVNDGNPPDERGGNPSDACERGGNSPDACERGGSSLGVC